MTDSEKELRRLAQTKDLSVWAWSKATTPTAVLALLDRIEALESDKAELMDAAKKTTERLEAMVGRVQSLTGRAP